MRSPTTPRRDRLPNLSCHSIRNIWYYINKITSVDITICCSGRNDGLATKWLRLTSLLAYSPNRTKRKEMLVGAYAPGCSPTIVPEWAEFNANETERAISALNLRHKEK